MLFGTPMIWLEPASHNKEQCYFCAHDGFGYNRRTKKNIVYSSCAHAFVPTPHDICNPVPIRADFEDTKSDTFDQTAPSVHTESYQPSLISSSNQQQLITHE